MNKLFIKLFILAMSIHISACLPINTIPQQGSGSSRLSNIKINLPQKWDDDKIFGTNCQKFIKEDGQNAQNCNEVTQRLTHYNLMIQSSTFSQTCTSINKLVDIKDNIIQEKVKTDCVYNVKLDLGKFDQQNDKFSEYYSGSITTEKITKDTTIIITLKAKYNASSNSNGGSINTLSEADLNINIDFDQQTIAIQPIGEFKERTNINNLFIADYQTESTSNSNFFDNASNTAYYYLVWAIISSIQIDECINNKILDIKEARNDIQNIEFISLLNKPLSSIKYYKLLKDVKDLQPQSEISAKYTLKKGVCLLHSLTTKEDGKTHTGFNEKIFKDLALKR